MVVLSLQNALVLASVALSSLAAGCWWSGWPEPVRRLRARVDGRPALTLALVVGACAAIWTGIFLVYRFPISGDVKQFFQPQGRAALAGGVPNADFDSSYMPMFPYLMGILNPAGSSDFHIPLFFAECFVATGCLLLPLARSVGIDSRSAATLAVPGLLSGGAWLLAIGYQQDESLLLLLLVIAIVLRARDRGLASGVVLGLGLLVTKALFLVSVPALLAQRAQRGRAVAGFAATVLPVIVLFLWLGWNPCRMLAGEAGALVPPSLPAILSVHPAVYSARAWVRPIAYGLVGVWILCGGRLLDGGARAGARGILRAVVGAWLGLLVMSPKSLTSYRLLILLLLPVLFHKCASRRPWLVPLFCAYSTVVGVQYMFYEDWINMPYAQFLHEHAAQAGALARLAALMGMDVFIVGCEIVWLVLCLSLARDERRGAVDPAGQGCL